MNEKKDIKSLRIDKFLSNLGYGTRREIKKVIKEGRVTINDDAIKDEATHINPARDIVRLDGAEIIYIEYEYIMLNKPAGYVSAVYDPKEKTVTELLNEKLQKRELFPVGRLDKDTEGLLLMTDDGVLAHNLLSPVKHVYKTYYAKIDGIVTEADIEAFKTGVILNDGYKTMPAFLEIIESDKISIIKLKIREGKFHQVKRMFESVGKKVIYLKRISMGGIDLDESLGLGEYRRLTPNEISIIKMEK